MKITAIIIRTLIGLLFLVSVISYFFNLMPQEEMSEGAKLFVTGMAASVYLFPVVKITELLCAIAFISGRFVTLATVVIFPIIINIVLFHAFLAPAGMLIPVFLLLGNLFLAFYYRKNYETLVLAK